MTTEGVQCVFPFIYNTQEYNECRYDPQFGGYWCSTTSNYDVDGEYGFCEGYSQGNATTIITCLSRKSGNINKIVCKRIEACKLRFPHIYAHQTSTPYTKLKYCYNKWFSECSDLDFGQFQIIYYVGDLSSILGGFQGRSGGGWCWDEVMTSKVAS